MNLKEAFRYQNKLQNLMDEAEMILKNVSAVTSVKDIYLYSKVTHGAEDETVLVKPQTAYAEKITQMVEFSLCLLEQMDVLSRKIQKVKSVLPIDLDTEVNLNAKRQDFAKTLAFMDGFRSLEQIIRGGGTGYRFNSNGDQIEYKCDIKRVTTINFDRKIVRKKLSELYKKSDIVSSQIDQCIVNTAVDYKPPFDVNDRFENIFDAFCEAREQQILQ